MKFRETFTDLERMIGMSLDDGLDFYSKTNVVKMSL